MTKSICGRFERERKGKEDSAAGGSCELLRNPLPHKRTYLGEIGLEFRRRCLRKMLMTREAIGINVTGCFRFASRRTRLSMKQAGCGCP